MHECVERDEVVCNEFRQLRVRESIRAILHGELHSVEIAHRIFRIEQRGHLGFVGHTIDGVEVPVGTDEEAIGYTDEFDDLRCVIDEGVTIRRTQFRTQRIPRSHDRRLVSLDAKRDERVVLIRTVDGDGRLSVRDPQMGRKDTRRRIRNLNSSV